MSSRELLLYDEDDGIGIITINRPEVHNALNLDTIVEFRSLMQRIETEGRVRALILTGAGQQAFISGGDLREFQELKTVDEARRMAQAMKEVTDRIEAARFAVIAAINGYALGGGCEVAVACDVRIASSTAVLGFRQIKLGLISGWGGGPRLIRLLGPGKALRLMLTGETLTAEQALALGLVDQVVPPDDLLPAARTVARSIAENAPLAIAAYKRLARMTAEAPLSAALAFETELFGPIWVSQDHEEAVRAHFEKRAPRFTGR